MSLASVNSDMFHLLWMCLPVLVSIFSFFVFTALGNELTVSVAFTVGSLLFLEPCCIIKRSSFSLSRCSIWIRYVISFLYPAVSLTEGVRTPPNFIPTFIAHILQVRRNSRSLTSFYQRSALDWYLPQADCGVPRRGRSNTASFISQGQVYQRCSWRWTRSLKSFFQMERGWASGWS